jgi:hypothetical protein
VSAEWRRLLMALILLIAVASPVVELFDQWDQSLQNDTEATVVIVVLCVGAVLLAARALIRPPTIQSSRHFAGCPPRIERPLAFLKTPFVDTGPPLVLRV